MSPAKGVVPPEYQFFHHFSLPLQNNPPPPSPTHPFFCIPGNNNAQVQYMGHASIITAVCVGCLACSVFSCPGQFPCDHD